MELFTNACNKMATIPELKKIIITIRVWRYQRGNQNPQIEKEWLKEKGQKDKHLSTKHIHKTKDRVTRTPLKTKLKNKSYHENNHGEKQNTQTQTML